MEVHREWSQTQLAEATGLSPGYLSRLLPRYEEAGFMIPIAVVTEEIPTMPTALAVDVAKSVERRVLGRATGHRDAYVRSLLIHNKQRGVSSIGW